MKIVILRSYVGAEVGRSLGVTLHVKYIRTKIAKGKMSGFILARYTSIYYIILSYMMILKLVIIDKI